HSLRVYRGIVSWMDRLGSGKCTLRTRLVLLSFSRRCRRHHEDFFDKRLGPARDRLVDFWYSSDQRQLQPLHRGLNAAKLAAFQDNFVRREGELQGILVVPD